MNEILLFLAIAPRKTMLQCKPENQSAAVYRSVAYVDASITEAQTWRGLIGTTLADFSFHVQETAGDTLTSKVRFHRYLFFPTQLAVGEREGAAPPEGGGGAPGGVGGGGGYSSPSPPSANGGNASPQQMPGPGQPPAQQPRGAQALAPEISPLLRQELTVVQNNSCDVLGSRGIELSLIRVQQAEQSVGMDQLLEFLFSIHLPNRVTTIGEQWNARRIYTIMGLKTKMPLDLRFTLWPVFSLRDIGSLDTESALALARLARRPWMMSEYFLSWALVRRLPGIGVIDDNRVAVITFSGSYPFEGVEMEERPEEIVERKYKGTVKLGALLFFDYWNGFPLSLSSSQTVQYTNHQTVTPLIEEAKPYTSYLLYSYTLDYDTSRESISKERWIGARSK